MSAPFWVVVRTHPNSESVAVRNLERQSFKHYLPKIVEPKIVNGKRTQKVVPLFPCYMFVLIERAWHALYSTYGIAAVIGPPSHVPEDIIENLKNRENSSGYIVLPKREVELGDSMRIKSGWLQGEIGLVEGLSGKHRQQVLLALLSNKIKVMIPSKNLELI